MIINSERDEIYQVSIKKHQHKKNEDLLPLDIS